MTAEQELIRRILAREGGVADVGDGKGVTRWGQTPGWLVQFGLPVPTTEAQAIDNYVRWLGYTNLRALIVSKLDSLADVVIDLAVHSGHVTAIKALQKAVKVTADGILGPVTLRQIEIARDRQWAAAAIIAWRVEQQGSLIATSPAMYAKYALGWARRNAEHIRRLHP